MLELNSSNYFSLEADQEYMSNSQYKDFMDCEARAMAKLAGAWKEPPSESLLIGSYVHAWADGTLEDFRKDNPDLFTNKGELYAKYKNADRMIETLAQDEFIQFVLQGQKEVIMTAEFAGAIWKIKMDSYYPQQERFSDLKTVKAIREKYWDKELREYVSFVEAFGYTRQMALYAEIERRNSGRKDWLESLIVAVSKEDPPDKAVIAIDAHRLEDELLTVERNLPHVLEVKAGEVPAKRCEKCRYCRETKKIQKVTHYLDLIA